MCKAQKQLLEFINRQIEAETEAETTIIDELETLEYYVIVSIDNAHELSTFCPSGFDSKASCLSGLHLTEFERGETEVASCLEYKQGILI